MAVFRLPSEPYFPDPALADPDGLLAVGGDLSPQRLVAAYSHGVFPWYDKDSPILWWSTDPRCVLIPEELHVPRSVRRIIKSGMFEVTLDRDFDGVINSCARCPRPGQEGTWLVPEMIEAYQRLHAMGLAHSVEAWHEGELVGGLYGVSLGRCFFGESMFYRLSNASKVAFVQLVRYLERNQYHLVDCQQTTEHVLRFGAREIPRVEFMCRLEQAVIMATNKGRWSL